MNSTVNTVGQLPGASIMVMFGISLPGEAAAVPAHTSAGFAAPTPH